ncbi:hypothetical protein P7K49_011192, partial [Saguinus oedipus]
MSDEECERVHKCMHYCVEKLVKYLDPNDLGRINFKDFCRGVFAMKGEVVWALPGALRSCPAGKAAVTGVPAWIPTRRGPRAQDGPEVGSALAPWGTEGKDEFAPAMGAVVSPME